MIKFNPFIVEWSGHCKTRNVSDVSDV